jgi:hypothetical protein
MKKTTLLLAYLIAILPSFANTENSPEFKIDRLGFDESYFNNPQGYISSCDGGIAVTAEKIFMTDVGGRTFIVDRNTLSEGIQINKGLTALCSDFLSGKAYVLLTANGSQVGSGDTAVRLAEVNSNGDVLSTGIQLSDPITFSSYPGIFSGYGRIAIYTSGRVFDVELPSGKVRDLGAKVINLNRYNTAAKASWGVVEKFNDSLHLIYIQNGGSIVRMRLPDQSVETLSTWSNYSSLGNNFRQINAFSVWPDAGKWYFYIPYYYNFQYSPRVGSLAADFAYSRVLLKSVQMRPGTTLMDVVFRVVDYDNPTAKVRALAFKEGVRSFSNIIKPTTFVEGTASKIGNEVPTNEDHTLTWDVAADWNVDLGQLKFEVLALDSKGLLPFNGITIPAANGRSELKINQAGISDSHVLNGLFWMYADGHPDMAITNGNLVGSSTSGVFKDKVVVQGSELNKIYAHQFLFKLMNISAAGSDILKYAETATRTTKFARDKWLTTNWPYEGSQFVYTWGEFNQNNTPQPEALIDISQITVGTGYSSPTIGFFAALKKDRTVTAWTENSSITSYQIKNIPESVFNITQIEAGYGQISALTIDGKGISWGHENYSKPFSTLNSTLNSNIVKISSGESFVKKDGSAYIPGYGFVFPGQNAKYIDAQGYYVLKDDGALSLVVSASWMGDLGSFTGLSNVKSFSLGFGHGIALHNNGTVSTWGNNSYGQKNIPPNLSNVIAVAAGGYHNLALKSDGTVVAWGLNSSGQCNVPAALKNVAGIAARGNTSAAFTAKAP